MKESSSLDEIISEIEKIYSKTITYYVCWCIKKEKQEVNYDDNEYHAFNNDMHK